MEYYSLVIKNRLSNHTATWVNFQSIMLNKNANLKRLHTVLFHLLNIFEMKNYRNREEIGGSQESRREWEQQGSGCGSL